MRVALGLEYDGSPYCGWQSQASGCGVQDHVEAALTKFIGAATACTCAGRTDTGVHALAQVIHVDSGVERDAQSWVRGGNSHLPAGIRLLWAKPVADEFHARFSARSRTYRYLLLNDSVASGTMASRLGWFHAPLDLAAMQLAARSLLGERDFSAFRSSECQAKTPVKTLYQADVVARGKLLEFRFRANAFLHHMVRNLVGELVYVGSGRHSLEDFAAVVAGRDRTRAAPTFPAAGLYLTDIEYDESFGLPAPAPRHPFFS